jgi:glycosyltransferase involved in cell wall biosynthesis
VRVAAVLSGTSGAHPLVEALERDGVPTTVLHIGARGYRAERRAIEALCREMRPNVVHTHGFRPDVVDGGVARREQIPVVSTCHGFIEGDFKGRLYQTLQRRALRRFDAVIAVSDPIAARLRAAKIDERNIHLIPNAFSCSRDALSGDAARAALGIPRGRVVGWVGRLSAEKGPDLAIDALARVEDPAVRLVVIGDGRERMQLVEQARSLGVSDRIVWCGSVPDAGRFFAAFDAFLLSSRTEGTPMALFEAMAANVPIVATRVGGVPQVVDESTALLVPAGDVDAMAAAVKKTLADAASANQRASAARNRLEERFAIDGWLERHETLYRTVIEASRRRL